jgi:hypothetical protein
MNMNDVVTNEQWLDERANEIRASIAELERLRDSLAYLQIGWRPPEGGWSIGQVVEHLILTDQPYLADIARLLMHAKHGGGRWHQSMLGGFITRAVSPQAPRKAKAFKGFQPGPEPRAHVFDDYIEIRRALLPLIEQSKGVDLNRARMKSPVLGLIHYNLGDAYMILTRHTQRHLQQIERVRTHPQFPS